MNRPALALLVALFVSLAACSSGGSAGSGSVVTLAPAGSSASTSSASESTTTTTGPPATLPASVDPGSGAFTLGATLVRFGVTECNLAPQQDPDTGVVTNVLVAGDDGHGTVVTITQQQTTSSAGTTVTDTVRITRGNDVFEASRFSFGGTYRDARDPTANGPLLVVDATEQKVTASGTFGAPGSVAGGHGLVRGGVIARCP